MESYFEIERNNKKIRGVINIPEHRKEKMPCILFCHGFTGCRNEAHFMFVKIARAVEKQGYVSARFDFQGSGESDGEFRDITLSSEVEDCEAIYKYVINNEYVDKNQIILLGHSMGSLVSVLVNTRNPGKFKKTILLSPAITVFEELIMGIIGDKLFNYMKNGKVDFYGNVISKKMLDEIYDVNYFKIIKKISGDVLLIHGTEDKDTPPYNSIKIKEILKNKAQLKLIEGSDHCYTSELFEKQVIDTITEFLK